MQVHFGTGLLRAEWFASVACVGTFDGVHLGHQIVIRRAVAEARARELPCALITFDRHPASVLAPERCPKALSLIQDNLAEFQALGVAICLVLPFDAQLSRMSADRFLAEILIGATKAKSLVVGHDFAMGNGRVGTATWLAERIPTEIVPPFEVNGVRVSSSAIRTFVEKGDVGSARSLLGRPFVLSGVVVGGQKLGRQLGFPTANLARSFDQVLPADGVYAADVETHKGDFRSALSIGTRPAVGGKTRTIEAYLIDYPGDSLYGRDVRIGLLERLREERDFADLEALTAQIEADVQMARDTR